MFEKGFVNGKGDAVRATGSIAGFHDYFLAEGDVDGNDVALKNFPVEIVEDFGSGFFIVGFPFPVRSPEVGGDACHDFWIGGGGGVGVRSEGGETVLGVGKRTTKVVEIVGFELGGGKVGLQGIFERTACGQRVDSRIVGEVGIVFGWGRGVSFIDEVFDLSYCGRVRFFGDVFCKVGVAANDVQAKLAVVFVEGFEGTDGGNYSVFFGKGFVVAFS